jgi:hypothetical protein
MNMTDQEEKKPAEPKAPEASADDRYRYIGFDVFPGKIGNFWKNDSERDGYVSHVREAHGKFVPLSRANSIVAAAAISSIESLLIAMGSLLLVLAPLLPWFSFTRGNEKFVYSGYVMLLKAGAIMKFLSLGSSSLTTSFILLVVLMLVSVLFGLATLYGLFLARKHEASGDLSFLHRVLSWHYLPIVGWVALLAMAASPTELPFGPSLGLTEVGTSLNIASLIGSSSVGFWIPFGALWVNAVKGSDI